MAAVLTTQAYDITKASPERCYIAMRAALLEVSSSPRPSVKDRVTDRSRDFTIEVRRRGYLALPVTSISTVRPTSWRCASLLAEQSVLLPTGYRCDNVAIVPNSLERSRILALVWDCNEPEDILEILLKTPPPRPG